MNPKPQPLVKWVGGKRQLQEPILKLFREKADLGEATYFEPFFGGGAMLFAADPKKAFTSDLNVGLVNLYKTVKAEPSKLVLELAKLQNKYNSLSADAQKELYLRERTIFNSETRDGIEMAARFIFLNKAGFNGMYRENVAGGFNIPFGKRTNINLALDSNIYAVSAALQNVDIEVRDYKETVDAAEAGDLVYFDPPYVPLTATSSFTSYTSDGFTDGNQVELRDLALELTAKRVHVVLSNSSAPRVLELYKDFRTEHISASRNISASAAGRLKVYECLITNAGMF